MRLKRFLGLASVLAISMATALLLGACQSPQEKSGVNPKPFNTPSSWETNPGQGQTIE